MEIIFGAKEYRVNSIDLQVLDYLTIRGFLYFDFPNLYSLIEEPESNKTEKPPSLHPSALHATSANDALGLSACVSRSTSLPSLQPLALTAALANAALRLSDCGLHSCCNAALMHEVHCRISKSMENKKVKTDKTHGPAMPLSRRYRRSCSTERLSNNFIGCRAAQSDNTREAKRSVASEASPTNEVSSMERSDRPKDKDRMISIEKSSVKRKKNNEIESSDCEILSTERPFTQTVKEKLQHVNKKLHIEENESTRKLQFSDDDLLVSKMWEQYAKEICPWVNYNSESQADAIRRIKNRFPLTKNDLIQLLAFVRQDEFWRDKAISPNGLLKRSSSNGLTKLENIKTSMNNTPKAKLQRTVMELAKDLGQDPFEDFKF